MPLICIICDRTFTQQFNLNKHYKKVHKTKPEPPCQLNDSNVYNIKCLESTCNVSYKRRSDLIRHLKEIHDFVIETEKICYFKDYDEFEVWKSNIEKKEKCNYIKYKGKRQKTSTKAEISWYICNRSYRKRQPPTVRKRNIKKQGSCKLSYACISNMKVTHSENGICIDRVKTHYGHELQLEHLGLSKKNCATVEENLEAGDFKEWSIDSNVSNIETDEETEENDTTEGCTNREKISAAVATIQQTLCSSDDIELLENSVVNQVCLLLNNANTLLSNKGGTNTLEDTEVSNVTLQDIEKQTPYYSTNTKIEKRHPLKKPMLEKSKNRKSLPHIEEVYIVSSEENDHSYF